MDDRNLHDEDEHIDTDVNDDDIDIDDDETPDDDDSDDLGDTEKESKKEVAKEAQKKSWLQKIKEGKKSLDDMPDNLNWLKKDIEKELKPDVKQDEIELRVRRVLKEERAEEDFNYLVQDLQDADLNSETEATLRGEYEDLISEFSNPTASQKLKALMIARKLAGLKDSKTALIERRRKGMSLPPMGTKRRDTGSKKESEIEKRLGSDLPPGWK